MAAPFRAIIPTVVKRPDSRLPPGVSLIARFLALARPALVGLVIMSLVDRIILLMTAEHLGMVLLLVASPTVKESLALARPVLVELAIIQFGEIYEIALRLMMEMKDTCMQFCNGFDRVLPSRRFWIVG